MEEKQKKTSSASAWAWFFSIAFHIGLLAVFAILKFTSLSSESSQRAAPIASIKQINQLSESSAIIVKPKIKKLPASSRSKAIPFDLVKRKKIKPSQIPVSVAGISRGSAPLPDRDLTFAKVEFFGQLSDQRKICYVVDCSGSMQGLFSSVRRKLKESILGLRPDQYFYIILFRGDKLLESGDGKLMRATSRSKSMACDFIDSAKPSGGTNAFKAIKRAMEIRDRGKRSPGQIYFLTDGFDLGDDNTRAFSEVIENMRKRLAPSTRINTIGFWATDADCTVLRRIAKTSGGEFVNIR